MSEAVPANAAASRFTNKKWDTNVNKKLLMECQAVIAYACYDSSDVSRGGVSMTEASMEKIMMKLCFGDETDTDAEIVCYADQFLLGLNKFQGLYTASALAPGSVFGSGGSGGTNAGGMLLSMLPSLHRQPGNINIFVGEGSIVKALLSRKIII